MDSTGQTVNATTTLRTPQELRDAIRRYHQVSVWLVVVFVTSMLSTFGLAVLVGILMDAAHSGGPGEMTFARTVMLDVMVIGLVLPFGMLFGMSAYINRRYRVNCPLCNRPIESNEPSWLMATHRCPHCHGIPCEEWQSSSVELVATELPQQANNLIGVEELRAAEQTRMNLIAKNALYVVIAVVGWVVPSWLVMFLFEDRFTRRWGDMTADMRQMISLIPSVALTGVGLVWVIRRADRVSPAIPCHKCGNELKHNGIVRRTGNCSSCGTRVLHDVLPPTSVDEPDSRRLLDRDAFIASARQLKKRELVGCLLSFAAGVCGFLAYLFARSLVVGPLRWKEPASISDIFGVTAFAIGPFLSSIFWFERQRRRNSKCPHCQEALATMAPFVISTRNCPSCGRQVLTTKRTSTP